MIDWWLIDEWWLIDFCLMDDWFMIDWRMIDDLFRIDWWLIDDWVMSDWWVIHEVLLIDWWLIDDWLMFNGMALSQFWLCFVILDWTGLSYVTLRVCHWLPWPCFYSNWKWNWERASEKKLYLPPRSSLQDMVINKSRSKLLHKQELLNFESCDHVGEWLDLGRAE